MIYELLSPIVANLIPAAVAVYLLWQTPIGLVWGLIRRKLGLETPLTPTLTPEALAFRRGYGPETPWMALALIVALGCMFVKQQDDQMIALLRSTVSEMEPTVDPANPDGDNLLHFMDFGDGSQHISREGCSEDCSGHIAGWKWAAQHKLVRSAQCSGSNSPSFETGCKIYLWRMGYAPEPE